MLWRLFLNSSLLVKCPLGGYSYTWAHKSATKMSKSAIKAIHGVNGASDNHKSSNRNSIWLDIVRDLSSLKQKGIDLLTIVRKKVGNGENTLFWDDSWLGEAALKIQYTRLYALEL
ncbi:hypothetical protein Tco_0501675, partial [Tanacetum coccineum]